MFRFGMVVMCAVALAAVDGVASPRETEAERIGMVLDDLHDSAAKADGDRYFATFAPGAVFLGTDASERWTLEEFRIYAMARFATGTGWTYAVTPNTRHVTVQGDVAWFDELLVNAKYGTCRGSGVLRRIDGRWRIALYNLSIPIPNDLAVEVAGMIRRPRRAAPGG